MTFCEAGSDVLSFIRAFEGYLFSSSSWATMINVFKEVSNAYKM